MIDYLGSIFKILKFYDNRQTKESLNMEITIESCCVETEVDIYTVGHFHLLQHQLARFIHYGCL